MTTQFLSKNGRKFMWAPYSGHFKIVEYYESPEFEKIGVKGVGTSNSQSTHVNSDIFSGITQVILDQTILDQDQVIDTNQTLTMEMEIDKVDTDSSDLLNTAFISDYCSMCYKITCICDCKDQCGDNYGEMMVEGIDFAVCSKCFEENVMFECDMCCGIPKTNFWDCDKFKFGATGQISMAQIQERQSADMEECV